MTDEGLVLLEKVHTLKRPGSYEYNEKRAQMDPRERIQLEKRINELERMNLIYQEELRKVNGALQSKSRLVRLAYRLDNIITAIKGS